MKRVLLSIAMAVVFVVIYLIVLLVLFIFNNQTGVGNTAFLYPVTLPNSIYNYFFRQNISDPAMPKWIFLISNVVLYSIPFYLLLTLFSKRRKNKLPSTEPPPPPTFDA